MSKRILCIVGTRPEAIKMAPVILALRQAPDVDVRVLATAQHRELLDQAMSWFGIEADTDLDVMQPDQTLAQLTARTLIALDDVLERESPDIVVAQGDTTSVAVGALASFYRGIPFGHVEAGLRTGNPGSPIPEEMNRVMASRASHWHFSPTERAAASLRTEGIPDRHIYVTGNPEIDALLFVAERDVRLEIDLDPRKRLVLVTVHRRENHGTPLLAICRALRALADRNPDIEILLPVHPNPRVAAVARDALSNHPQILLCDPLEYGHFIAAMKRATLVLTDSGGVQEEAPALAKPVLVLRDHTERPESIEAGVAKLVGSDCDRIVAEAELLLRDPAAHAQMARGASPYGDGKAAARIRDVLLR